MANLRKRTNQSDKREDREKKEFDNKVLDVARVTRVVAGGKRMRFRACVIAGNRNGKIGMGVRKGLDVADAVGKATRTAEKTMISVSLVDGTIPHQIYQKLGAAKLIFKPASRGTGIVAGGPIRAVLELAGVQNVAAKILGTNNKINNAQAAIKALSNLRSKEKSRALREIARK
ncbi:MAG TPA: 30S ribosomal protein S5 [Patescibacteria group bacterium]|nr:30S ribosomal protein S5 [Patescibacteria group bacterium]